eukprot:g62332.t1
MQQQTWLPGLSVVGWRLARSRRWCCTTPWGARCCAGAEPAAVRLVGGRRRDCALQRPAWQPRGGAGRSAAAALPAPRRQDTTRPATHRQLRRALRDLPSLASICRGPADLVAVGVGGPLQRGPLAQ